MYEAKTGLGVFAIQGGQLASRLQRCVGDSQAFLRSCGCSLYTNAPSRSNPLTADTSNGTEELLFCFLKVRKSLVALLAMCHSLVKGISTEILDQMV